MRAEIEPLIPSLWFERIEKIAGGHMASAENALRHAFHLLQLTPLVFRDLLKPNVSEDDFEELLETGSFAAAARRLVSSTTSLSTETRGESETYRAIVGCPALGRPIVGHGDSEAEAILDAWTACLLALRSEYSANQVSGSHQPTRKYLRG